MTPSAIVWEQRRHKCSDPLCYSLEQRRHKCSDPLCYSWNREDTNAVTPQCYSLGTEKIQMQWPPMLKVWNREDTNAVTPYAIVWNREDTNAVTPYAIVWNREDTSAVTPSATVWEQRRHTQCYSLGTEKTQMQWPPVQKINPKPYQLIYGAPFVPDKEHHHASLKQFCQFPQNCRLMNKIK